MTKPIHSYYWLDDKKKVAFCRTCNKQVNANTAFHFRFDQQSTLASEILASKE